MRALSLLLPFTLLLSAEASASQAPAGAWPFTVGAAEHAPGELALAPDADAIAALAGLERATLQDVALPGGARVDLSLERLDVERLGFGFQVDGAPAPGLLGGLDLSVWRGVVVGEEGSQVALSFSHAGSRGWILSGGQLIHLAAVPGAGGDWSRPSALLVDEQRLLELGLEREPFCVSEELVENEVLPRAPSSGSPKAGGAPSLYECRIAIETDWQLHQVFGSNLPAQTAYVTSLLTWVSYRYEEQIATVLTYPYVQFYTTSNDPWVAQDQGGNCIDVLFEFQAAWQNNVPAGGEIGHMLSGANLGCGVAWLPGLCNAPYNFSVSGNINGGVSFPVQVSGANWDFMVVAHELGHNFGSPHTHDYCPPLDECAPSGYFGQCQTQQTCTSQGTIMSYCHLCAGGTNNITTYFHPANVVDMRAWVESTCLPLYGPDPVAYCTAKPNSLFCVPLVDWQGHPTLSGLDDFVVSASSVINNKNGILFYGSFPASQPFQGGTLCVAPPITRTPTQSSGGNPPPDDCSGSLSYAWPHVLLASPGLGAGASVFVQFWYRDPLAAFGSGLSDALSFTILN